MGFSDQVLTKGKSGKLELRTLRSRGSYVMCEYRNPETLKLADRKNKLMLRNEDDTLEEYFIIPLRDPNRALFIKPQSEEKERKIWNPRTQQEEDLWMN